MTNKTTSAIDLLAPCPKCHFQDQRPLGAEASCHHTAHTCSGSGEFVVICPRCKHSGPLKARPEWAVEAWNEQTKPSAIDLVTFLQSWVDGLDGSEERGMLQQSIARINSQSDTITRLQAALKPFVRHYDPKWMDEWPDDTECSIFSRVTYGQLREAVAALRSSVGGE